MKSRRNFKIWQANVLLYLRGRGMTAYSGMRSWYRSWNDGHWSVISDQWSSLLFTTELCRVAFSQIWRSWCSAGINRYCGTLVCDPSKITMFQAISSAEKEYIRAGCDVNVRFDGRGEIGNIKTYWAILFTQIWTALAEIIICRPKRLSTHIRWEQYSASCEWLITT